MTEHPRTQRTCHDLTWVKYRPRDSMDLSDVKARVDAAYPGATIRSIVQACAYLEEFESGIKAFATLDEPTPEDDRWLGVCYFQSFEDAKAQAAFERAVARGLEAARVNLAHLLRAIDRADRAADELRTVDFARLNAYDRVFFLRVRSIHEETNGNLREALRYAEEAWRMLQGQPEFSLLAPSILTQLGILHGRIGRAQRAVWFLEKAVDLTTGLPKLKAQMRWATVMVAQGQLDEASHLIDSLKANQVPGPLQVEIAWLKAEIAWARGEMDCALHHYSNAIDTAQQHQVAYEEFLCQLAVATILAFRATGQPTRHLHRAQALISDRSDQLTYRFREILIFHQASTYAPIHAIRELEGIALAFGEMSLLQEQGNVRLHLAALKKQVGDPEFQQELEALRALATTLQNPHFLARELNLVPGLEASLRDIV